MFKLSNENLILTQQEIKVLIQRVYIDEFEWKQRQRNPLLIKIKQLREQLNNKKRG